MPPASAPSPSGARRTPCWAGGGGWKRGPEIAVGAAEHVAPLFVDMA